MNSEPYVVTLGVDFADGRFPSRIIHELYRGTPCECVGWMHRVAAPSHDQRVIVNWWLQCGRVCDWEAYAQPF